MHHTTLTLATILSTLALASPPHLAKRNPTATPSPFPTPATPTAWNPYPYASPTPTPSSYDSAIDDLELLADTKTAHPSSELEKTLVATICGANDAFDRLPSDSDRTTFTTTELETLLVDVLCAGYDPSTTQLTGGSRRRKARRGAGSALEWGKAAKRAAKRDDKSGRPAPIAPGRPPVNPAPSEPKAPAKRAAGPR